ncbi:MAG: DUF4124 domain-containing protein [Thiobacillus sp.]|nr:DUF4124 domain-containing protein [Thiobacillus sp.]
MTDPLCTVIKQAFRSRAGGLLFFVCALFALPAAGELYKWVDGSGKVHYSDQPPTVGAQTVRGASAAEAAISEQATQSLSAREQAYQKRLKEDEEAKAKAGKEAEQARLKRENCDKARNNLVTLQNKTRVYSTNTAGQRVYLDDRARAQALASSQKAVAENCR